MAPRNSDVWQVNYPEIKMRTAHLFRTREWSDCTFQFESSSLDAHKLLLSMASPVFAAMFYGYVYTDAVTLSDTEQAKNLYIAANMYLLVHLENKCLDYLFEKLDCNNVCKMFEFACLYSEKLKTKCLELISSKTVEVLKNPDFRKISVQALGEIVSMETMNVSSEMELFNAVVDYLDNFDEQKLATKDECVADLVDDKQPPENATSATESNEPVAKKRRLARKHLPGIIEKIRFLTMAPNDLAESSEVATVLTKDEMLALLANLASSESKIPMPEGFSTSRDERHPSFKWKSLRRKRLVGASSNEAGEEQLRPTDEEIKECVRVILDGANLEQITMKTVCQEVFSRYPECDIKHRRDFIKQCVKSLI
ncbi:hypothetical protein NE865_11471 [Phthorimaea operculella]|nr:hypothetical protein NE865_11471 [Phthorimaea operculella]